MKLLPLLFTVSLLSSCGKDDEPLKEDSRTGNPSNLKAKRSAKTVALKWDGKAANLNDQLAKAVNESGKNGVVIILNGSYLTDEMIKLHNVYGITIKGAI